MLNSVLSSAANYIQGAANHLYRVDSNITTGKDGKNYATIEIKGEKRTSPLEEIETSADELLNSELKFESDKDQTTLSTEQVAAEIQVPTSVNPQIEDLRILLTKKVSIIETEFEKHAESKNEIFHKETDFKEYTTAANNTFSDANNLLKNMSPDALGGILPTLISASTYRNQPGIFYTLVEPHLDKVPEKDLEKVLKSLINHRWIIDPVCGKELLQKLFGLFKKLSCEALERIKSHLKKQSQDFMDWIQRSEKLEEKPDDHPRRVEIGKIITQLLNFAKPENLSDRVDQSNLA